MIQSAKSYSDSEKEFKQLKLDEKVRGPKCFLDNKIVLLI